MIFIFIFQETISRLQTEKAQLAEQLERTQNFDRSQNSNSQNGEIDTLRKDNLKLKRSLDLLLAVGGSKNVVEELR